MSYWKLTEDPFYDEDGVLIDEDGDMDWEDSKDKDIIEELNEQLKPYDEEYGPFVTINS